MKFPFSRPSVFTKSENCPSEVPPTAGRRGTLSPESVLPTTLNEAILASSSRVRDSLPKEHRTHFETLRQEIIDFAKAHNIPRESLAKPDALRKAAEHLSIPDLTQLANLLERFQYLLANKKPHEKDPTIALEYVEKYYHLREQYDSQVEFLKQLGILKEGAIMGVDGKEYPVPTLEQIARRLFERHEDLETKHDQGFTKLLLVPFGIDLDTITETLEQFLIRHKASHPHFCLNEEHPVKIWSGYKEESAANGLFYYPISFQRYTHYGRTKRQILKKQAFDPNAFPGWVVQLFQPSDPGDPCSQGFASLLRDGDEKTYGRAFPRPDIPVGKTASDYLLFIQKFRNDKHSPYFQESGMTPEDWVFAFMTHMRETGQPFDCTDSSSFLIGAFFPIADFVPFARWFQKEKRAGLTIHTTAVPVPSFGIRTSVII